MLDLFLKEKYVWHYCSFIRSLQVQSLDTCMTINHDWKSLAFYEFWLKNTKRVQKFNKNTN